MLTASKANVLMESAREKVGMSTHKLARRNIVLHMTVFKTGNKEKKKLPKILPTSPNTCQMII